MVQSILVVDDQLAMRRMFKAIFAATNYEVQYAEDGNAAYRLATTQRFDLVLTDFHMPHCNGVELTSKLRMLSNYVGVPILIVSTESNKDRKMEGKNAGANGWIVKPIKPDVLLPAVEKLLN